MRAFAGMRAHVFASQQKSIELSTVSMICNTKYFLINIPWFISPLAIFTSSYAAVSIGLYTWSIFISISNASKLN